MLIQKQGGPTGENLSSGYANASASVIAWGHERVDYDYEKGEFRYAFPSISPPTLLSMQANDNALATKQATSPS